jgi:hypothetical protein
MKKKPSSRWLVVKLGIKGFVFLVISDSSPMVVNMMTIEGLYDR